jgi:diaminohydroxyphosphoribosylaminopyrimidine deaminase/5-amino-6-(5-phosphoribosylamino)uracil reductase
MATEAEIAAMRRAIAVSAAGIGSTSPNPPVGCVLLDPDNRIVGEGYHERKGESHAEVNALAAAGALAQGATAVVTLEPCNHQGRTPACRQALIEADVKRVVIALIDPTSRGKGGAAALREAGVEVVTGVLAKEARVVLGPWLTAQHKERPLITWSYLVTNDQITAVPGDTAEAAESRFNADAVLGEDGIVAEAVSGRHGAGILELPKAAVHTEPAAIASFLHAGGVRRLLLDGGLAVAAPFLAASLVDRLVVYLPEGGASISPKGDRAETFMPPGFTIASACKSKNFTRIEAQLETVHLANRSW